MCAWMLPAAMIGGGLLDFAGGMLGNAGAKEQQEDAQDWQRHVMQHAMQWTMSDYRAAGLNPIMAAGGANAAPSSGISQIRNPMEGLGSSVRDLIPKIQEVKESISRQGANEANEDAAKSAAAEADARAHVVRETGVDAAKQSIATQKAVEESSRASAREANAKAKLGELGAAGAESEALLYRGSPGAKGVEKGAQILLPLLRIIMGK